MSDLGAAGATPLPNPPPQGGRGSFPIDRAPAEVDGVILRLYADLKTLLARDDLDPSVRANLVQALADVSLVVHDLGLDYEMLYDLGV